MGLWLVKSDPESYSFADLERDGRTVWDGVANALALRHLGAMRVGDECLIYESGKVKAVVGRARVVVAPRPDPAADDPRRLVVDLEAGARLAAPVSLATIKADGRFAELALVRQSRLSVMPLPRAAGRALIARGRGARR
jgi:predicted RNA-binding protein with PUA-like domain